MPGVVSKADVRSGAAGANRERPCLHTQGPHFCLHTPPRPEIHAQNRYLGFFSTLFYHGPAPSHAMSTSGDETPPGSPLDAGAWTRARACDSLDNPALHARGGYGQLDSINIF